MHIYTRTHTLYLFTARSRIWSDEDIIKKERSNKQVVGMYVHKHTSVSSNKLTDDRVGRTMEEIIRHGEGERGVMGICESS